MGELIALIIATLLFAPRLIFRNITVVKIVGVVILSLCVFATIVGVDPMASLLLFYIIAFLYAMFQSLSRENEMANAKIEEAKKQSSRTIQEEHTTE